MANKITGEDVASLLHGIHEHDIKRSKYTEKIIYFEEDLLPVLEALGLPKPIWKESMSVKEWEKQRR